MSNGQIGISFLPSQENADQGLQRGAMEGDLGQALKVLSLRLPRVMGARAITPTSNLGGSPNAALGALGTQTTGSETGAFNPNAALFQALVSAMLRGGGADPMKTGVDGTGGTVNPYIKFIREGEPNPGSFDPITTETGEDPTYKKPETNFGKIGGDGMKYPEIPDGTGAVYRKQPSKFAPEDRYAFNTSQF